MPIYNTALCQWKIHSLREAEARYPRWLTERRPWLVYAGSIALGATFYMAASYTGIGPSLRDSLFARVSGSICYALSATLDHYSTYRAMRSMERANQEGVFVEQGETFFLFRDIREPAQFIRSPITILPSIAALAVGFSEPTFSYAWSFGRLVAAANNFQINRRYNYATHLAVQPAG